MNVNGYCHANDYYNNSTYVYGYFRLGGRDIGGIASKSGRLNYSLTFDITESNMSSLASPSYWVSLDYTGYFRYYEDYEVARAFLTVESVTFSK